MIEGITKPFEANRPPLTSDQMRAAAAAYIAGMRDLFGHFDPLTGGSHNPSLEAPFGEEADGVHAVPERGSSSLEVFAPDTQWHSYRLRGNQGVWRHDGIMLDSLNRPDAERVLPPRDATDAEKLTHFHRLVAEDAALKEYESNEGFVDEEEVTNLFALLMQGHVAPEIDTLGDL
jgi:hypothetical protein